MKGLTRRQAMRLFAATGATAGAAAVLAACGETQVVTKEVPVEKTVVKEVPVEKVVTQVVTKEAPVEKIVTKTVEVIKELQAQRGAIKIELATDHTSGPRGKALSWAIEQYGRLQPNVKVKYIPQDNIFYEKIAAEALAGTLSEVNLRDGVSFKQWVGEGIWLQINDILKKNKDFNPENYHFMPDVYTDIRDQDYPYNRVMLSPQFGMPYQAGTGGLVYNITAVEAAGVAPHKEGWRYDDLLEAAKKVTNADKQIFGLNADKAEEFYAFPAAYGYNNGQARVMGPKGAQIWGPFLGEGVKGWEWIIELIHKHKVAYKPEARKGLSG